jgi:hypothetical protein
MIALSDLIKENTQEINGHCRWYSISKYMMVQEAISDGLTQSELNKLHYELKMELHNRGIRHVKIFKKKFQDLKQHTKNKKNQKKIDDLIFRLDDMIAIKPQLFS